MGQYFKLVNISKQEYIHPHCCGDGAKLVEITTGGLPSLLAYLLRQSSESGGGDIDLVEDMEYTIKFHKEKIAEAKKKIESTEDVATRIKIHNNDLVYHQEQLKDCKERKKEANKVRYAGRWAGDRITLVGDYDESKLYDEADSTMQNITHLVMEEYNQFVSFDSSRVFANSWHACEEYNRAKEIEELKGYAENDGFKEDTKQYYLNKINTMLAEDEYYGYKEPNWKFQLPKSKEKPQRKGVSAPDMVLSVGGNS